MKRLASILLLLTSVVTVRCAPAIPDQFRPSYQLLGEQLSQARGMYPFVKEKPQPIVAPNLCFAASIFNPSASDSKRWNDLLATLDAFKAMGMKAVLVQIMAPDLALGDTRGLLNFYERLVREIHSRDMQLYVEHFVNIPFEPNQPFGSQNAAVRVKVQDTAEGRAEFLKILEQEVTMIYREIKPDYLSVLTEPEAAIHQALHLSFSGDELAKWVTEISTQLKGTGASPKTLLGTGGVTYEPEEFFLKVAQQTNLDYVDIHLYAIKMRGEDQIAKFTELIHKIRVMRPEMKVTIGEAWLMKQTKEGPKATIPEIFARNDFSFWNPLDEQFVSVLLGLAQKENIAVVVPYFSQYFFSYYTFGDAESAKLPTWPGSVRVSWNKAVEAIRNQRLSATGEAVRGMLTGPN